MTTTFILLTLLFVIVSVVMILIILVQRPQGGGLAGAFGGAGGGSGAESMFGGRVGDALTWATVVAFVVYLTVAISLNLIGEDPAALGDPTPNGTTTQPAQPAPADGATLPLTPVRPD